ncbi:MAG TPA: hypothetical protein VFT72_16455 [Opitutaceae bacterium]|nr:hypothetical protein [Opitutaceae bacterium]
MQQLKIRSSLSQWSVATLAVACSLVSLNTARAVYTWQNIQFGGFASQGYLQSSDNDYLGKTEDGTFDFREYGVNASWSHGAWRAGAQVFGQKLGEYGDDKLKLDWATIDYQPSQYFGIRAGRVKMPRGLYNEALDLDAVRPYVLLPQSVYDARLRDFNAAFNGAMVFGNVEISKAGSLDYRLFYGHMPLTTDSGAADYFNNDSPVPVKRIHLDAVRGGALYWNTPVNGLRFAYSYSAFAHMNSHREGVFQDIGPVVVDKYAKTYERHLWSAEYVLGNWTLATEYGREHALYNIIVPVLGDVADYNFESKYYYFAASRRMNSWLELGAYYSHSHEAQYSGSVASPVFPHLKQGDYALSARFDINEHLSFKLEGHYMEGSGKIFDTPTHPQPLQNRDNSWTLIAAKVSVVF